MNCGLIDIPCHIWAIIGPIWFWIQLVFWLAVSVLALWGLSKIKEIGGWPAVAGVAGLAIYAFGWMRGRKGGSINPIEQIPEDHPDAATPRRRVRRPSKPAPASPKPPESLSGS